jgi:hypothetical protein
VFFGTVFQVLDTAVGHKKDPGTKIEEALRLSNLPRSGGATSSFPDLNVILDI